MTDLTECTHIKKSITSKELVAEPQKTIHGHHEIRMGMLSRMFQSSDIKEFISILSTWRDEWEKLDVIPLVYYLAETGRDSKGLLSYYPGGYKSMVKEYRDSGNPTIGRVFGDKIALLTFTPKAKERFEEFISEIESYLNANATSIFDNPPEELYHKYHNLHELLKKQESTEAAVHVR